MDLDRDVGSVVTNVTAQFYEICAVGVSTSLDKNNKFYKNASLLFPFPLPFLNHDALRFRTTPFSRLAILLNVRRRESLDVFFRRKLG